MKPYIHARSSAKRFGGIPEDYLPIHDFFDSTKQVIADSRHRAILHSAFGIFVAERVFGTVITNSDGKKVSVRDVGEQHVMEDMGEIPSMEKWFRTMQIEPWMLGTEAKREQKIKQVMSFNGELND